MSLKRSAATVAALTVGMVGIGIAVAQQSDAATSLVVVGHRGSQDTVSATENGKYSVKAGLQAGAKGVEIDVRLTKDGQQIVMHDKTLDRTTTCTGEVAKRTYNDIRTNCKLKNGEKVPNVYELAWTFSKYDVKTDKLWLHVKFTANAKQRASLFKAVDKYSLRKQTIVLADEDDMLDDYRKWSGIERALIFNQADVNQGDSESWGAGFDYAVPYQVEVTSELVAKAHKAGSKVYGVESKFTIAEAISLNLDGFVANDVAGALV
jgi:glycerophosphoryl diester phosphodiesterase